MNGRPDIAEMQRHIKDLSQALREAKRWNHVLRRERDDFESQLNDTRASLARFQLMVLQYIERPDFERLYHQALRDVAPWNTPDQKALMESIYEATKKPQEQVT